MSDVGSEKLCSCRNLIRSQKCFHQFAFAADDHSRKAFEPFAFRSFRLSVEPIGEQTELVSKDFARANPVEKMVEQGRRKIMPPDFRHYSFSRRKSHERSFRESLLLLQHRRFRSCGQRASTIPLR